MVRESPLTVHLIAQGLRHPLPQPSPQTAMSVRIMGPQGSWMDGALREGVTIFTITRHGDVVTVDRTDLKG